MNSNSIFFNRKTKGGGERELSMASSSSNENPTQNKIQNPSTLHRRPVNCPAARRPRPTGGPLIPDVDPPPKPPAIFQLLAVGFIVFFACLQFLPATHVRDPTDPLRSWIPLDPNYTANSKNSEIERIDVYSWTDCLDLRALAVLVNSTLSSSRFPSHIYFHFLVPQDEDEKMSHYKLKVLLPHSNLDVIGEKEAKEKLKTAIPEWELLRPSFHQLMPLFIPIMHPSLSKFIYIASNTMIKGNIEGLFGVDLGLYAIAAANDCSRKLGDYVNINVVNAIQRTGAKAWVSNEPYNGDACVLDFNLLLFDAQKLNSKLIEAILWWSKVLNMNNERNNMITGAVMLALHNKYVELPSTWKLHSSMLLELDNKTSILPYDGPARVCSEDMRHNEGLHTGDIWLQYLNPKSDAIFTH